jgi:hypothetical protein
MLTLSTVLDFSLHVSLCSTFLQQIHQFLNILTVHCDCIEIWLPCILQPGEMHLLVLKASLKQYFLHRQLCYLWIGFYWFVANLYGKYIICCYKYNILTILLLYSTGQGLQYELELELELEWWYEHHCTWLKPRVLPEPLAPFLVLGEIFSLFTREYEVSCGLSIIVLYQIKFCSIPSMWRVFMVNCCWIQLNYLFSSLEMFRFFLVVIWITLIDSRMVKQFCLPG